MTYIISRGRLHAVFIAENNSEGAEKKGFFIIILFRGRQWPRKNYCHRSVGRLPGGQRERAE